MFKTLRKCLICLQRNRTFLPPKNHGENRLQRPLVLGFSRSIGLYHFDISRRPQTQAQQGLFKKCSKFVQNLRASYERTPRVTVQSCFETNRMPPPNQSRPGET
jgi:hypothetical protein